MKNIKLFLTTALIATLTGCVNGDDYNTPDLSDECVTMTSTIDVQDVTSIATSTATQYTSNDVIEAYVTSSDEGGNFYKSISLVSTDEQQGFTIPVDSYNLYTKFEPGRLVYINMENLYYAYDSQTSSYEIGNLYNGTQIGRLSGVEFENIILRSCTKVDEEDIMVTNMSINDITSNNSYMHKLIELDNVQFTDESIGKTYYDPTLNSIGGATNHRIADINGSSIIVRVSEFANFAANEIPSGSGKIRGILTKYNNDFQFMIRTLNDVKLENPRIVPLFEETFEITTFPNWTAYNVIGAQVWNTTNFGNPAPSAIMNGFSSGSQNNEDWLISPAIDLTNISSVQFSFETSTRFSGPTLEIYVSTDYDGSSAPNTASWTQITTANLPVWTSGGYTPFTSSGGIDITSFSGSSNFRIAFKYTSTTSGSAAWEVDNVKVIGN